MNARTTTHLAYESMTLSECFMTTQTQPLEATKSKLLKGFQVSFLKHYIDVRTTQLVLSKSGLCKGWRYDGSNFLTFELGEKPDLLRRRRQIILCRDILPRYSFHAVLQRRTAKSANQRLNRKNAVRCMNGRPSEVEVPHQIL
jgi:hypothetical protein